MRRLLIATACALTLAAAVSAQQADPLAAAATALGTGTINSLEITGAGRNFSLGQNYTANEPWPAITVTSYTAQINYQTGSMRQELVRDQPNPTMPRGGGAPFQGQQRQIQVVSGDFAWNVPPAPPPAQPEAGRITAAQALQTVGALPPGAGAQPAAGNQTERMLWLLATPHGFVKAAQANNATSRRGRNNTTEVSFTVGGKYQMTGVINAQVQVESVRSAIYNPIVGDMPIEARYTNYRDFGGVTFPANIVQLQDGYPTLELTVSGVKANPAVDITTPDNVRAAATAAAPPQTVTNQELAPGVQFLTGGSHHSLAVDMGEYLVVADLPLAQARAAAVLAKAKELFPNKPVRYVVTTHHHWDHLGGIREAFAEGARIVTHRSNEDFLERVARAPHTLNPDRQATARGRARIDAVNALRELKEDGRTIQLHLQTGLDHAGDMLLIYLPAEKILAMVDTYTPPAQAGQPLAPPARAFARSLYDNIQRLKLDVQTIVPFHGNRTVTMADLARDAGVEAGTN
jgi:glyoxylase-like metal-dependent hydrolase (beta-lactamase superfamily II)